LGALAIPVLIHLIQRERKRVVEIPVADVPAQDPVPVGPAPAHPRLLLLAMRLAGLALIVLAFARPFFKRTEMAAATQNGAREAVILVDTSYSMEYGDRWQKAKSAATDAIRGLAPGDRARWSSSRPAPKSPSARRPIAAARGGARRRGHRTRRDPVCPRVEARRQPARRIGPAAARDLPDQRLQRRGWEQTPGRDDVKLPSGRR
jgi:hypothetical protein